jgi:hypothetical protein
MASVREKPIKLSMLKLSTTKRFWLLSILGLLGAISFLPTIAAESASNPSSAFLVTFVIVVAAICACATWIGLRCADAVHLPMPYLRLFDGVFEAPTKNGFLIAGIFGVLFALASIALLRFLRLPNLAGPLWSRLASTIFAAGSLELVLHLGFMSLVVKLTSGRRWTGILAAAVAFVIFHVSGLADQGVTIISLSVLMNGLFGLALGVIYSRFGIEYVLLCHAIGHILAVSFA